METAALRSVRKSPSYAGDISPREVWECLKSEPRAMLIDVRTPAEWTYSGMPDLASLGKTLHKISWKLLPDYTLNPAFAAALRDAGAKPDTPIYFLCRSGGRSRAAAAAMTEQGYTQCYNVQDGFEGPLDDASQHRGEIAGWKASQLPWGQE